MRAVLLMRNPMSFLIIVHPKHLPNMQAKSRFDNASRKKASSSSAGGKAGGGGSSGWATVATVGGGGGGKKGGSAWGGAGSKKPAVNGFAALALDD